eukprot:646732-Pelagomonas_calceolata.AAC.2
MQAGRQARTQICIETVQLRNEQLQLSSTFPTLVTLSSDAHILSLSLNLCGQQARVLLAPICLRHFIMGQELLELLVFYRSKCFGCVPRWQAIFSAAGACPLVSGASLLPPPSQLATLYHEGEDQDVEGSSKADTRNQQETGFACLRGWQPGFCEPLPLLGELPSLKLDGSCS